MYSNFEAELNNLNQELNSTFLNHLGNCKRIKLKNPNETDLQNNIEILRKLIDHLKYQETLKNEENSTANFDKI